MHAANVYIMQECIGAHSVTVFDITVSLDLLYPRVTFIYGYKMNNNYGNNHVCIAPYTKASEALKTDHCTDVSTVTSNSTLQVS